MTRTYNQMHCTDKYSQQSSIIWPVWPNDWVFVYKLSGCGFKSHCSRLKLTVLLYKMKKYDTIKVYVKCKTLGSNDFFKS